MEKKENENNEFSFMNQKANIVNMKLLGEKQQQTKKNLKFSNIINNNNDNLAKHMTGWAKEKTRLQIIIQNLQEENARLSCQVALIEGARSQRDRDKIFRDFEADFKDKAHRLEQRKKKLIELDKLVHSFRCIEQEEEELSKMQNLSSKNNSNDQDFFTRKQKLAQTSSNLKFKKDNQFPFLDDSDDEIEEDASKSNHVTLQEKIDTTFSAYRKKKTIKTRKFKKYLVTPPPQSLIVTNINPYPLNKSSYPPSATVSAASAFAFQQQQNQSTTITTTTTTIKSGQQYKTVQFTPQHQKQRPSKVLQNVQKLVDADTLYHQNLNARRNVPPTVPLLNPNESKTKSGLNTKSPSIAIDRAELVNEHERLVAISLNLERVMLVKKMQLRLCHDHRDLYSLRMMFDSIEGGDSANTTEKQISRKYKTKIKNLKTQIQREKTRLIAVMQKQTKEEQAAISIQNLMRGFLC